MSLAAAAYPALCVICRNVVLGASTTKGRTKLNFHSLEFKFLLNGNNFGFESALGATHSSFEFEPESIWLNALINFSAGLQAGLSMLCKNEEI